MKNFLIKNKKNLLRSLEVFFSFSLMLLFLGEFTTLVIYRYYSFNLLFCSSLILPFLWFYILIKGKKNYEPYFKYDFLIGLIIITLISLNFSFKEFLFIPLAILIATLIGFLIIPKNSLIDKLNNNFLQILFIILSFYLAGIGLAYGYIEPNFNSFGILDSVVSFYKSSLYVVFVSLVILGVLILRKNLNRSFDKLLSPIRIFLPLLTLVLVVVLFLRFYNLGELGFHGDEFFHQVAAEGIKKTLLPYMPSNIMYIRGIISSYLAATGSYFIPGELGYRLLQAILTLILYLLSSFMVFKRFGRSIGMLYMLLAGASYWSVELGRYLRFYGSNMFTIIILLLFLTDKFFSNLKTTLKTAFFLLIGVLQSQATLFLTPLIGAKILSETIPALSPKTWNWRVILSRTAIYIVPIAVFFLINFADSTLSSLPGTIEETQLSIWNKIIILFNENLRDEPSLFFFQSTLLAYPFLSAISLLGIYGIFLQNNNLNTSKNKIIFIFGYTSFLFLILSFLQLKEQQRIMTFLLPVLFLLASWGLLCLPRKLQISSLVVVLASSILPAFSIPFRDYGDKYQNIKILSSVEPFYPDYKTPALHLNKKLQENKLPVVQNAAGSLLHYPYLKENNFYGIDYYHQYVKESQKGLVDPYTGNKTLKTSDLQDLYKQKGGFYFITSYDGFGVKIYTKGRVIDFSRLSEKTKHFIVTRCKQSYLGKDKHSVVFICKKDKVGK